MGERFWFNFWPHITVSSLFCRCFDLCINNVKTWHNYHVRYVTLKWWCYLFGTFCMHWYSTILPNVKYSGVYICTHAHIIYIRHLHFAILKTKRFVCNSRKITLEAFSSITTIKDDCWVILSEVIQECVQYSFVHISFLYASIGLSIWFLLLLLLFWLCTAIHFQFYHDQQLGYMSVCTLCN